MGRGGFEGQKKGIGRFRGKGIHGVNDDNPAFSLIGRISQALLKFPYLFNQNPGFPLLKPEKKNIRVLPGQDFPAGGLLAAGYVPGRFTIQGHGKKTGGL
jgi:hypothetical protein